MLKSHLPIGFLRKTNNVLISRYCDADGQQWKVRLPMKSCQIVGMDYSIDIDFHHLFAYCELAKLAHELTMW